MAEKTNVPFFPGVKSAFDLTLQQTSLLRWINLYDSVYQLDDVERPIDQIISDDERFDAWYKSFADERRRSLEEYHRNRGKKTGNFTPPKPRITVG